MSRRRWQEDYKWSRPELSSHVGGGETALDGDMTGYDVEQSGDGNRSWQVSIPRTMGPGPRTAVRGWTSVPLGTIGSGRSITRNPDSGRVRLAPRPRSRSWNPSR